MGAESDSAATSPFRSAQARSEDRAVKRQALLTAAVQLFNERGFHATSLDDVAARVGVTKPVVYHYLGNKDRVLFECVRFGLAQLREAADAARAQPGDGLDRLKAFLRSYTEVVMGDFGRCVIRTGEETLSAESRAQFRASKREIDTAMRGMIEEAVADGSAQASDVRLTAFTIAGALSWSARWYRDDIGPGAAATAKDMVDILCAGLAPRAVP
jgi:AcrR family transcriptional regulator